MPQSKPNQKIGWLEKLHAKPETQRLKLMRIILTVAIILLVAFWLTTFKLDFKAPTGTATNSEWQQQVNQLGQLWQQGTTAISQAYQQIKNFKDSTDSAEAKEVKNIATQFSLEQWTTTTAAFFTIKHPQDWTSQETTNNLTLASYNLAGAKPAVYSLITISKQLNRKALSLEQWAMLDQKLSKKTWPATAATSTIAGLPALQLPINSAADVSSVIYAGTGQDLYEIIVSYYGDPRRYQPIVEEMLTTLQINH